MFVGTRKVCRVWAGVYVAALCGKQSNNPSLVYHNKSANVTQSPSCFTGLVEVGHHITDSRLEKGFRYLCVMWY